MIEWLTLGLFSLGVALSVWALRYRTPEHPPIPSVDLRNWVPIWRQKSWFEERGYLFHSLGWTIVFLAVAIRLILEPTLGWSIGWALLFLALALHAVLA